MMHEYARRLLAKVYKKSGDMRHFFSFFWTFLFFIFICKAFILVFSPESRLLLSNISEAFVENSALPIADTTDSHIIPTDAVGISLIKIDSLSSASGIVVTDVSAPADTDGAQDIVVKSREDNIVTTAQDTDFKDAPKAEVMRGKFFSFEIVDEADSQASVVGLFRSLFGFSGIRFLSAQVADALAPQEDVVPAETTVGPDPAPAESVAAPTEGVVEPESTPEEVQAEEVASSSEPEDVPSSEPEVVVAEPAPTEPFTRKKIFNANFPVLTGGAQTLSLFSDGSVEVRRQGGDEIIDSVAPAFSHPIVSSKASFSATDETVAVSLGIKTDGGPDIAVSYEFGAKCVGSDCTYVKTGSYSYADAPAAAYAIDIPALPTPDIGYWINAKGWKAHIGPSGIDQLYNDKYKGGNRNMVAAGKNLISPAGGSMPDAEPRIIEDSTTKLKIAQGGITYVLYFSGKIYAYDGAGAPLLLNLAESAPRLAFVSSGSNYLLDIADLDPSADMVASLGDDYRNPDTLVFTRGSSAGVFNAQDGNYPMNAIWQNSMDIAEFWMDGSQTKRYYPVFEVNNWTSKELPAFYGELGGAPMTADLDYIVSFKDNRLATPERPATLVFQYLGILDTKALFYLDPVVGPSSPGTLASDSAVGAIAWSSSGSASASDDSYASAEMGMGQDSYYLKATNFSFSIPNDATIDGIKAEFEGHSEAGSIVSSSVRLVKGGVISGNDKGSINGSYWSDGSEIGAEADEYVVFGGATDLWGLTLTPADINASNFGFTLQALCDDGFFCYAAVDHMRITVYYSTAGSSVALSGTAYSDTGTTPLTSKTVAVSVNGAAAATTTTTHASTGAWSMPAVTVASGDVLTFYLDGVAEKAVTVTKSTGSAMTGIDLYQGYLVVRSDNGVALTNANLDTANNNGDADIASVYSITGSALTVSHATGRSLYIPASQSFAPGGNVTVAGNFINNGTYTTGTETVTLSGTETHTLKTGGSSLYNLTFSGSATTYTLDSALTVTNNLTMSATAVDVSASNYGVTVGGIWTRSTGSFTPRSGTVTLTGTSTFSDTTNFYNLTINGSGRTVTLGAALTLVNNLTITAGTLDVSASNYALSVGGTFSNSGTFTPRSGTVTLSGTNQTLSGTTSFYNLTKNTTSTATLTFPASATTTITNALTLTGQSGALLSLRSSTTSTA